MKKYGYTILYILLMAGTGVWQLLDWYYGTEDPIWHLLFYIFIMPFLSFIYGLMYKNVVWIIKLLIVIVLTASVYLFMANGGMSMDVENLYIAVPSLVAGIIGVLINGVINRHKKEPARSRQDRL